MLIVFAQLLTVDSRTVCRHTRNTRVTKDVETMVTTVDDDQHRHHGHPNTTTTTGDTYVTHRTFAPVEPAVTVVHNHLLLPPPSSHLLLNHIHTLHFDRVPRRAASAESLLRENTAAYPFPRYAPLRLGERRLLPLTPSSSRNAERSLEKWYSRALGRRSSTILRDFPRPSPYPDAYFRRGFNPSVR